VTHIKHSQNNTASMRPITSLRTF